jgi:hypothetical protein
MIRTRPRTYGHRPATTTLAVLLAFALATGPVPAQAAGADDPSLDRLAGPPSSRFT